MSDGLFSCQTGRKASDLIQQDLPISGMPWRKQHSEVDARATPAPRTNLSSKLCGPRIYTRRWCRTWLPTSSRQRPFALCARVRSGPPVFVQPPNAGNVDSRSLATLAPGPGARCVVTSTAVETLQQLVGAPAGSLDATGERAAPDIAHAFGTSCPEIRSFFA